MSSLWHDWVVIHRQVDTRSTFKTHQLFPDCRQSWLTRTLQAHCASAGKIETMQGRRAGQSQEVARSLGRSQQAEEMEDWMVRGSGVCQFMLPESWPKLQKWTHQIMDDFRLLGGGLMILSRQTQSQLQARQVGTGDQIFITKFSSRETHMMSFQT